MARHKKRDNKSWLNVLIKLPLFLFYPAAQLLVDWAVQHPDKVEQVYSTKIYPFISSPWSRLLAGLNFSVAEMLLYALIVIVPFSIVFTVVYGAKKGHGVYSFFNSIISWTATAAILYFVFVSAWSLNYHRMPLATTLGYESQRSSTDELVELCEELVERANILRAGLDEDAEGVLKIPYGKDDTLKEVTKVYKRLGQEYEVFAGKYSAPKPIYLSEQLCYTEITGIFIPFTMEANVNVAILHPLLPSTACHEAAHQRGFAREDEANFIAYLACKEGGDAYFEYSGTLLALIHSMNALFSDDPDRFSIVHQKYSDDLMDDLTAHRLFWQQYQGPVAEKSTEVNNAYLKHNKQDDGVKSYGRMVDLLLAERRARITE